jgi:hypothetical protein
MTDRGILPVWFFVGLLLGIYGILILLSGLAEWSHPPATVLSELHAPVWWGALLVIVGGAYTFVYWPGRRKKAPAV